MLDSPKVPTTTRTRTVKNSSSLKAAPEYPPLYCDEAISSQESQENKKPQRPLYYRFSYSQNKKLVAHPISFSPNHSLDKPLENNTSFKDSENDIQIDTISEMKAVSALAFLYTLTQKISQDRDNLAKMVAVPLLENKKFIKNGKKI